MVRHLILVCAALLLSTAALASPAEDQIRQLEQKVAKAAESGLAEYAKDRFDSVRDSLAVAKSAAALGREREALQQAELAEARLNAAEAKAAEKEMVEKVAVRRAELKKTEALLERYRQGDLN